MLDCFVLGCTNKDNQLDGAVVNVQTSEKTVGVVLKEDKQESHNQIITLINSVHRGKNQPKNMILGEDVAHTVSNFQREQCVTFSVTKSDNNGDEKLHYTIKNNSMLLITLPLKLSSPQEGRFFQGSLLFGSGYSIEMLKNQKWVSVRFVEITIFKLWS